MQIVSIVGARPQFVKVAVVCRAVQPRGAGWTHRIIHTGQHYDAQMSAVFFEELGIPAADYNLGVGSGGHGAQTGEMLKRMEPVLEELQPDWVLLYGDTNSTLAGAIAASKLHLKTAHVEAGLRSYNRRMPEELNRVAADHLSDVLLCPTAAAVENLTREGLRERAVLTGDVMYDATLAYLQMASQKSGETAGRWKPGEFVLATVHRAENTDDPERLACIVAALGQIAESVPVVWPVHPRTRKILGAGEPPSPNIHWIEPVSYFDMLLLESRARFILTDSGGVQKEAYWMRKPCITLRDETEWVETLENGCNRLAGASAGRILEAVRRTGEAGPWLPLYGDGHAGEAILNALG
jgi:UDP-GlcNAc3NAcA epimerase